MTTKACRFCYRPLTETFCDLGKTPLSNSYIPLKHENEKEPSYPLHAFVCSHCFLVQLDQFETPENIFSDYAYFSSYSESWLHHAKTYAEKMVGLRKLGPSHLVVEIASNDGYLLQYFKEKGIPILGIEPALNVASLAIEKKINTLVEFFSLNLAEKLSAEGKRADLIAANNVLAHVPNLNDFVKGLKKLLKPQGIITIEFPHVLKLMQENQFDTIYHEHFSYFSLLTVEKIFAHHGLHLYDVEELSTHGGSLRIYAGHQENSSLIATQRLQDLKEREIAYGLNTLSTYLSYHQKVENFKKKLVQELLNLKKMGKTIVGYGAPAKGNTLLNFCEIGPKLIDYTVDRNPYKQGRLLPGSRIPIFSPEKLKETKPDYVFILPWNLKNEIMQQVNFIREWGGRFIIPIPEVEVI